jgi:HEAT repeats
MFRRRKLALTGCAIVAVIALLCWPRTHGPSYEGRTVEEWFKRYDEMRYKGYYDAVRGIPPSEQESVAQSDLMLAQSAFQRMGTNAVPYLVGRITQGFDYSRTEVWRMKIRGRLPQMLKGILPVPVPRGGHSITAAKLLSDQIKPPGEMLLPLIEPALQSTNEGQRLWGFFALRGISSGHDLARPYLERGLKDQSTEVQRFAADVIGYCGEHGNWAVSNLLELASSPDFDIHGAAIHSLNRLGTNSWPVLPQLKEMLAVEQDERRRKGIADAIRNIHTPGPGPPPMGKQ